MTNENKNASAANLLSASKTFPEDKLDVNLNKTAVVKWTEFGLATGETIQFMSEPGNGKTSFIKGFGSKVKDLNVVHLHVPTLDIDQLSVAIPQDVDGSDEKVLAPSVMQDLLEADVVLLDETRRAKESVRNSVMELVQNKTLGGYPLKDGVTFFIANNYASESGVSTGGHDLAQETRYITVELTERDMPWQIALGATFPEIDLTELFKVYNTLDREFKGAKKYLSPRTLEHIIWNIVNDLPGELALPLLAGPREWILDKDGNNVTDHVMEKFAAALGKPFIKTTPDIAKKAILKGIQHGKNVMLQGAPGIGKTAYVNALLADEKVNTQYWSLQNISPDEHVVPFPGENNKLELMLSQVVKPLDGEEYVLVADEYYRAKPPVLNMMLEMTQGGTLGGQDIPVKAVVAMTNPRVVNGQRQSVNKPDRAMADRFFVSVDLTEEDIPANEYLLEKYGDVAAPFIEWWKEDIDDLGRTLVTKRTLEKMIKVYEYTQDADDLEHAKPYLKDEHAPVPLHDLKLRLSKRPVARLKAILEKKDEYLERMQKKQADGGNEDQEAHIQVFTAIQRAEVSELKKAEDDLVDLVAEMDKSHRVALVVGHKGDRLKVAGSIMRKAGKAAKK